MPIGLGIGAATLRGMLHLVFRYRQSLFGPEAAASFADRYLETLRGFG